MTLTIEAKAELLIRKPVVEVFNAFVDPDHISKFWFDKSTGPLCENASVEWHWSMYNFFVPVTVYEFKQNEKIVMTWGAGDDASTLDWTFTDRGDDGTYVSLINRGFSGTDDEIVAKALDSTGGFNLVVAAAKAYLEHGIQLNVVADRF
tara:strand:+ start:29525 stop:29971 length:447 start_codon:yes stop_codon:yes gene_type:complete